ncbi:hypothetical protein LBMAG53_20230 [Planctomycetota bacterium]|nr:hypothetical protein LBMAG53_20230 [Planctomycetota bacterium]
MDQANGSGDHGHDVPSAADLRAFITGKLPADRFAAVDAWLARQSGPDVEQALADIDAPAGPLPGLIARRPGPPPGFQAERAATRHRPGSRLGEGGMAVVFEVRDQALDRIVAMKVLKPRQADESLESFLLRETAFRREAARTAALEHPAIVPVHDVGITDGRPAFIMQRVTGRSLDLVVEDGQLSLAKLVQAVLRVAEAVAFAHSRGLVHRDLSPANILIGEFGAVYVLDWGVAERIGAETAARVGTPAWMAPEQAWPGAVNPRLDVFALGGLLFLVLTGHSPRPDPSALEAVDDSALDRRGVPRGLAAVARRCLRIEPAERYPDAQAVADDLRRWLDEGITKAQRAWPWESAWMRLRHAPRMMTALCTALVGLALLALLWWWQQAAAIDAVRNRVAELVATVPLDQVEAVAVARAEVRTVRSRFPNLREAADLDARLTAAWEVAQATQRAAHQRSQLIELLHRTRIAGPATDQIHALRAVLRTAGLTLDAERITADSAALAAAELNNELAEGLAFLWRAERERGADHHAANTAAVLAGGGPTDGWKALGRVLGKTGFRAHDPIFCVCADSESALADPRAAAVAVALFGPEPRLAAYARQRLMTNPGEFWPLIAAAQAALAARDLANAQRLAYTAFGAEPASLLPHVVLAYVSLEGRDWPEVLHQAERGLIADQTHAELRVLRAVGLANNDRRSEAQAVINALPAGHLRYHLIHRVGHPMERAVDAAVAAGLTIAQAEPDLGPISVPHGH